jgi:hypothetical protein
MNELTVISAFFAEPMKYVRCHKTKQIDIVISTNLQILEQAVGNFHFTRLAYFSISFIL